MRLSVSSLCLLVLVGCADDSSSAVRDAGPDSGPRSDAAMVGAPDAGEAPLSPSYGDGRCTEAEILEGMGEVTITTEAARSGPGLVSAYVDMNRERLDALWADCSMQLCPFINEIYVDCWANFIDPDAGVEDGGVPPANPCGDPPAECAGL